MYECEYNMSYRSLFSHLYPVFMAKQLIFVVAFLQNVIFRVGLFQPVKLPHITEFKLLCLHSRKLTLSTKEDTTHGIGKEMAVNLKRPSPGNSFIILETVNERIDLK